MVADELIDILFHQFHFEHEQIAITEVATLYHTGWTLAAHGTYCLHESPSQGLDACLSHIGRILEVSSSTLFQAIFVQVDRYEQISLTAQHGDIYVVPSPLPAPETFLLHLPSQYITEVTLKPSINQTITITCTP